MSESVSEKSKLAFFFRIFFLIWGVVVLFLWLWIGWRNHYIPTIRVPESGFKFYLPIEQFRAIFGFLLTGITTLAWGTLSSRLLKLDFSENKNLSFIVSYLIGSIVHSLIIFVIGILHLLPFGLILSLLVNGIWFRVLTKEKVASVFKSKSYSLVLIPIVLISLFSFITALGPPLESDGLRYHLFGPQEYLKAGGIFHIASNAFTNLPYQTQLLNMFGMWVGGYSAAQLIHWSYFVVIYLINLELTKAIRKCVDLGANPKMECFKTWQNHLLALLATTPPVIIILSSWPFIDLSTVAFTLGSLLFFIRKDEFSFSKKVILIALLSGGIISTKLTGLVPAFFNGLLIIYLAVIQKELVHREKLKSIFLYAVIVFIPVSPYLIKNTITIGNPVYPAGYGVFGGDEWDEDTDEFYKSKAGGKGFGKSPEDILLSPLDVTLRWSGYQYSEGVEPIYPDSPLLERTIGPVSNGYEDQNPGPAFLILLPFVFIFMIQLIIRKKYFLFGLLLLHLFGSWIFWIFTYQSVRFIMPQISITILFGSYFLVSLKHHFLRNTCFFFIGALAFVQAYWPINYTLTLGRGNPFMTGLSLVERDSVLSKHAPQYNAFQWIDLVIEEGEKVMFIGIYRGTYAQFDIVTSDWYDRPLILEEIKASEDNSELFQNLNENNIRYVLYDYGELELYLPYFRQRFTEEQFERFLEVDDILRQPKAAIFAQPGIIVVDLELIDLGDLESSE